MRHANTTALDTARRAIAQLGISTIEDRQDSSFAAESRLLRIETHAERHYLRLSCRLLEDVTRNKIGLWNVTHHNNAALPFGQFYIGADNTICFGTRLPEAKWVEERLTEVYFQLLSVSEAYYKMIGADFVAQPFYENEMQVNVLDLFRTELKPPKFADTPDVSAAASLLSAHLPSLAGNKSALEVSEHEFAVTDEDTLVSLQLLQTPRMLKSSQNHSWVLAVQTEVGVLPKTDDQLWVMLNRMNSESSLIAYSIRYARRKPILTMRSAITPPMLTDTQFLAYVIEQHSLKAPALYNALEDSHKIRSVVGDHLGL